MVTLDGLTLITLLRLDESYSHDFFAVKVKASGVITVVVLLGLGVFAGYYFSLGNPSRMVIPTDMAKWDKELAPAMAKLSDDDKRLAAAYLARAKIGELFGGSGIPTGFTLAQAITEQRAWEQAQATKDAEAKALETQIKTEKDAAAKRINELLTVALIDKSYVPHDYQSGTYKDSIVFDLAFQNKGNKDIAGVKGKTVFKDIFGDVIKVISLSYDNGIPAGRSVTWHGGVNYNQFEGTDVKLRNVDKTKLQFSFEPDTVIFSDGTKISAPEVPAR